MSADGPTQGAQALHHAGPERRRVLADARGEDQRVGSTDCHVVAADVLGQAVGGHLQGELGALVAGLLTWVVATYAIGISGASRELTEGFGSLFAAVVLAALDDAIADDKKYGNGAEQIARWARSRDGREVLSCAGIDPNERVVKGLVEFVSKGVRTSVALSREESERRMAAEEAEAA